eukprot:g4284.t1
MLRVGWRTMIMLSAALLSAALLSGALLVVVEGAGDGSGSGAGPHANVGIAVKRGEERQQQHSSYVARLENMVENLEEEVRQLRLMRVLQREGQEEEDQCEEKELDSSQRSITVVTALLVTSVLIIVTVVFEKGVEFLQSRAGESLKPLLDNMLSELTVLGFIGLLMFLATKFGRSRLDELVGDPTSGLFVNVTDCKIECDKIVCEENPLIELAESVHMIIFLVMMVLLLFLIVLLIATNWYNRKIFLFEEICALKSTTVLRHEVEAAEDEAYKRPCSWTALRRLRNAIAQYRFATFRKGFVVAHNRPLDKDSPHCVDASEFDFAEYIVKLLGETLGELVEISPLNWLIIWSIFMAFLIVDFFAFREEPKNITVVILGVALAYLSTLLLIVFRSKAGKAFILNYIRVTMLLLSIYVSAFVVALGQQSYNYIMAEKYSTMGVLKFLFLLAVAIIPVVAHVLLLPSLIFRFVVICNVEMMISASQVARVVRLGKTRQALHVLRNMSCLIHAIDDMTQCAKEVVLKNPIFQALSAKERARLLAACSVQLFRQGETVIKQGEQNSFYHIIVEGSVEILVKNKVVRIMDGGEAFGEASLLSGELTSATVKAKTQLVLYQLDKKGFNENLALVKSDIQEDAKRRIKDGEEKRDALSSPERLSKRTQRRLKEIPSGRTGSGGRSNNVNLNMHASSTSRPRLPEAEVARRRHALRVTFKHIDASSDGLISEEEILDFLVKIFPENDDIEYRTKQVSLILQGMRGSRSSEGVNEDDFVIMMSQILETSERSCSQRDFAKRMFRLIDKDGSGEVSTDEFLSMIKTCGVSMSYDEMRTVLCEYDDDLDGMFSMDEFVHMLEIL